MSFLSPLAFAIFGLSLPLVLLYFLKVRRRERRVSSLLLWEAIVRDREASTFFQRLQRDPLLILQILALLALTLALARPVATVMGEGARKVVIVLDVSASMKAGDVSPSRRKDASILATLISLRNPKGILAQSPGLARHEPTLGYPARHVINPNRVVGVIPLGLGKREI